MAKISKELIRTIFGNYAIIGYAENEYWVKGITLEDFNNRIKDNILTLKMCCKSDCDEPLKPLSKFRNKKRNPDGKDEWCKSCKKRVWDDYKKRNSEKVREYQKQYRSNNIEKIKENDKNYREKNRDRLIEHSRIYSKEKAKFEIHKHKLEGIEEIKCNDDGVTLDVKCTYCGYWFSPTNTDVGSRVAAINGKTRTNGCENRFYCSDKCKDECPIFGQRVHLKGTSRELNREQNAVLRRLVLERDNWTCQKCEKNKDELNVGLQVHHIKSVTQEPIYTNDIDNCITVCKTCHIDIHQQDGCRFHELRCKN